MVAQPDEPDWPAHEAAAAALASATVPLRARSVLYPGEHEGAIRQWVAQVRGAPSDVPASLVLLLLRQAADEGGWSCDTAERVLRLGRFRWTMPAPDATYAVRTAAELPDTWSAGDVLCCAVTIARRAEPPSDPDLRAALMQLASSAGEREYLPAAKRASLLRELELLTAAPFCDAAAATPEEVSSVGPAAARLPASQPSERTEQLVERAGLTAAGQRLVRAGPMTARLAIAPDGQVSVRWQTRRGWSQTPPAAASTAGRHLVRGAAREVGQALAAERTRLERLLAQDRWWPVADWRTRYCEHPVSGAVARGLIWIIEPPDDKPITGMPAGPGLLMTINGPRPVPEAALVRLWHPVNAEPAEIAAWREVVATSASGQPFSQAFREVYLAMADELLPAVKATSRFEGRLLSYPQAHAWLTGHGWTTRYLEPFSGVTDVRARRDFPGAELAAMFDHSAAGADPGDLCAELCQAGRLAFHRIKRGARTAVRLSRVPALVFTEAVRDLELLVAATEVVG